MTKGYKNPNDYVFLHLEDAWFWESAGKLYFFDIDDTCYVWSEEKKYWVESSMFNYFDYWYDGVAPETAVTVEDASQRFPGSVPILAMSNKTKQARRSRIRLKRIAWTKDGQIFADPSKLPRGFGFTDSENTRFYSHKQSPELHAIGRVAFYPGQVPGPASFLSHQNPIKYFAAYWVSGDDPAKRLFKDSKGFKSKNEAQAWLIDQLRKQEQAQRAAAKALNTNKEGEKNG